MASARSNSSKDEDCVVGVRSNDDYLGMFDLAIGGPVNHTYSATRTMINHIFFYFDLFRYKLTICQTKLHRIIAVIARETILPVCFWRSLGHVLAIFYSEFLSATTNSYLLYKGNPTPKLFKGFLKF